MSNNRTKKLVFTALCIGIGLLLPQLIKMLPIPNGPAIISPMHIPILICGFLCGPRYGAFAGFITPLIAFILTGMPPIFPVGLSMMFELATYGFLTGLLYKVTKEKVIVSLVLAMIGGRIVYGIVSAILFNAAGWPFGMEAFITGAFITALPGIIIHLILIPMVVLALKRAKLIVA